MADRRFGRAHRHRLQRVAEQPADGAGLQFVAQRGRCAMGVDIVDIRRLQTVSMSSTKSAIGHLLGGAGAVESIFCILAIRDQIVPPTLNLENPSDGLEDFDLVPLKAKKRKVKAVLNNSFGFGGTNASLIMRAVED
jgi:3-oxoacyl-(acyl-carrier-protein) synthase